MRFAIDRQFQHEWDSLHNRACIAIPAAELAPDGYARLLRIVEHPTYPGVPVPYRYELLAPHTDRKLPLLVVSCEWDYDADACKLATPIERRCHPEMLEPTLRCTQSALAPRRGRKLEKALSAISVPLIPKDPPMGVDGSTVKVTVGQGIAGLTLWWWVYAPAEWQPLGKIVDEVMRTARATQDGE